MPNPVCPINCDSNLPVWNFSDCNPQINLSEIRRLFFAKINAAPFTNWLNATEWMARLNQSSVANDDVIRSIDVIADLPAGSQVIKDISKRRKITVTKDRTLNFTIDDVSQENYEAARVLECNAQYKWWYETEGGFMYGGNEGIIANVAIDLIQARGADSAEELQGVLTWRSKFMPERGISPIFDSTSGGTPVETTFDTSVAFASSTAATAGGIGFTASAIDPDTEFEFNAITTPVGLPATMEINVDSVLQLVVDFPSDYTDSPAKSFRYTDPSGVIHNGTFTSGTVSF